MEGFSMTCAQRMARIRLMEKMEKSTVCQKDENGKIKYANKNGEILIEAEMKKRT